MRILVTRPEPDASAFAKRLTSLDHDALVEPLLVTHFEPVDEIELDGVQALIATSRNAIRALSGLPHIEQAQSVPLYVVGPGTAAAARALGFAPIIEGPRAGRELVSLIALDADVNGGPLMHLAGNQKAYDVAGELRRLGFHILEPLVYRMEPVRGLGSAAVEAIMEGRIEGIALFSPATARIWARLVEAQGISRQARAIKHFCLSAAVARELEHLAPIDVACAVQPNVEQMLALVACAAPQSR